MPLPHDPYLLAALFGIVLFIFFVLLFYPPQPLRRRMPTLLVHGSPARVVAERLTGFFFFGILPLALLYSRLPSFDPSSLGLVFPPSRWVIPSVFFWVVLILAVSRVAGRPANLEQYPQMRKVRWTLPMVMLNAATWALYLAGYEFLFRGLLLFPFLSRLGTAGTLIFNLLLYALAHLHKGWREVAGSFVFGTILVLATIYSGSLMISYLSHLVLALSNGFFAARATKTNGHVPA